MVEYLPKATGEYVIHIHYNDVAIPNSPFTSKVYDINQIKVKEMPKTIQINKPATFLGGCISAQRVLQPNGYA